MADVTPRRQAGATALGCRAGIPHGFPLLDRGPSPHAQEKFQ